MSFSIVVENIKCGGCANSITSGLQKEFGIAASVDVEKGEIMIDADEGLRGEVVAKLKSLGYPEQGSTEGIERATTKAKSFVSCAIGRLSDSD